MNILFLDTETTDIGPTARLIQLAYKNPATGETINEYFKPPVPISFGSMAVHHVTNEMVADKPVFEGSEQRSVINELLSTHMLVAHNAPFDMGILKNEGVETKNFIDTLRVARHLIENAEQHKLQYLRYFLGLKVEGSAHDALGDILVLEQLFAYLKNLIAKNSGFETDEEILERMILLTKTPILLKTFTFGKYKDMTFEEVARKDTGYLKWLLNSESQKKEFEQNEELVYTLRHYTQ
ncbi:MAG: 3'-5' exonuclease [Candidatus Magasanikbacteria bacterium]|nr:3'-5' exonuclease [Candidatus Magasanikbacteria bacterium]